MPTYAGTSVQNSLPSTAGFSRKHCFVFIKYTIRWSLKPTATSRCVLNVCRRVSLRKGLLENRKKSSKMIKDGACFYCSVYSRLKACKGKQSAPVNFTLGARGKKLALVEEFGGDLQNVRMRPRDIMNSVAGVLDEPYSQLSPLSGVAIKTRQSTSAGTVSIQWSLAGRYGDSA
jgi:hypothetical protein